MTIPDASKLDVADDVEDEVNSFIDQLGIEINLGLKEIGRSIIQDYNREIRKF